MPNQFKNKNNSLAHYETTVPEILSQTNGEVDVDDSAFIIARRLATNEGIFVGMSGGAAVFGALEIARKMKQGTIVVILPDREDRYLSTTLFRSICGKCPP